jgi:PPK2 family polyphosphate:nucleotide phosphotransferase
MDLEVRFRVPQKGFRLAGRDPADTAGLGKAEARPRREHDLERLAELQERLLAERRRALLVVVQGLDASGKDGTIAHVMRAADPQALSVTCFKQPTRTELAHDFLWRVQQALPPRGHIGVFNRSHYEEVVVVRVHPELLAAQAIDPARAAHRGLWEQRFEDIVAWERHLARAGTRVVKLFLHISKEEQRRRFLARAEQQRKRWKFSAGDVAERAHWDDHQRAYDEALRATSTPEAPWYVIPADHKWFARTAVAAIVTAHLRAMRPRHPQPTGAERAAMEAAVARLRAEVQRPAAA